MQRHTVSLQMDIQLYMLGCILCSYQRPSMWVSKACGIPHLGMITVFGNPVMPEPIQDLSHASAYREIKLSPGKYARSWRKNVSFGVTYKLSSMGT